MDELLHALAILAATALVGADNRAEDSKSDEKSIEGTWALESVEFDGEVHDSIGGQVVFDNGKMVVRGTTFGVTEAGYRLDPRKDPKHIDLIIETYGDKKSVMKGIYLLEGDRLRLCYHGLDGPRPGTFEAKGRKGLALMVLKRVAGARTSSDVRPDIYVQFPGAHPVRIDSVLSGPPTYDWVAHEGLVPAYSKKKKRMGFLDRAGKVVIPFKFILVFDFEEGLARVADAEYGQGYIDKTGQWVIRPSDLPVTNDLHDFSEGLAGYGVEAGTRPGDEENEEIVIFKYGFIDRKGDVVIEPQFDDVEEFSEGLAAVKLKGKWGFVDHKGNLVIEPKFDDTWEFSEGLAPVEIEKRWGYIDRDGRFTIEPNYTWAYQFHWGRARVSVGKQKPPFYIDHHGEYMEDVIPKETWEQLLRESESRKAEGSNAPKSQAARVKRITLDDWFTEPLKRPAARVKRSSHEDN